MELRIDYILTVFITIVTVVDPLGLIPIYVPIAEKFPKKDHKKIIIISTLIALIVSSCFLFLGKIIFKYLQIDFSSIYIVGGILLFIIGLDMIFARPRTNDNFDEDISSDRIKEISVFPLAIPMLSGPGTIATLIMFSSKDSSVENYAIVFTAMFCAFLLAAIAMFFSGFILKILGKTGINVLDRVMGIILCALAVQFLTDTLKQIFMS